MKQIIIPIILAATVIIAGFFAFSPIEEATTVHTLIVADIQGASGLDLDDIQDDTMVLQKVSAAAAGLDLDNGDFIRVDCDVPFTILGLIIGEDEGIEADDVVDIDGVFLFGAGSGGSNIELDGGIGDGYFTFTHAGAINGASLDYFSFLQTIRHGMMADEDLFMTSVISEGSPVDFELFIDGDGDEEFDVDAIVKAPKSAGCTVTGV